MKFKNRMLIISSLAIIILIILILVFNNKKSIKENNQIDTIENFNYSIKNKDTILYKETFEKLKKELSKKEIDYDKYAELVSLLFVIDFYTLDNKITNSDIGGLQFIYENNKENFIITAENTIYKYIKNNLYNDRKQSLPIVKKAEVLEINNINFIYGSKKDENAYKTKIKIEYEEDMDYPNKVEIILIHNEKKLEIVEIN